MCKLCRDVEAMWEAACVKHVEVASEMVDKLEQLVRR
jgi:hypothetical protein